jgi:ribonuclease Z
MDRGGKKDLISKKFSLTFLGTAAATVFPGYSTSAYLVEINRHRILIDAGRGVFRQLRKSKINPEDIEIVLITHWHIDHYAGLPAVLRARNNSISLSVYGPRIPYFARLYLTLMFCPLVSKFEVITEQFSRDYSDFSIRAISNLHGVDSYGWSISENVSNMTCKGRRIIVSGDTRPSTNVLNAARGADLLVHEATYLGKHAQTALLHNHSTNTQAAQIAASAGVKILALTHIPVKYPRLEVQKEAEKTFPGVLIPSPLDTIVLDPITDNTNP